jgi:integrase
MSIIAEKKHGKPTGRWRVEVGGKDNRLRGRAQTFEEAQKLETQFKKRLAQGEVAVVASRPSTKGMDPVTLLDALEKAEGRLWEEGAWKVQALAHIRSLAALIGIARPLRGLTEDDFEEAVEQMLETKAPATVNKALSCVSKLLGYSRKKGWIEHDLELPWQREGDGRIRWLTAEEEQRLLDALPLDMRAFCILAIETGCRRGELLRITADDLVGADWLVLPKTKSGKPRGVPLTDRAQDALADLFAMGFPSQQRVRQQFEKARAAAGLADVCFHILRHTCATRLLERGVDLQLTKEWMGHADLKTTLRYRHVSDNMLKSAARQMNLSGGLSPKCGTGVGEAPRTPQ